MMSMVKMSIINAKSGGQGGRDRPSRPTRREKNDYERTRSGGTDLHRSISQLSQVPVGTEPIIFALVIIINNNQDSDYDYE